VVNDVGNPTVVLNTGSAGSPTLSFGTSEGMFSPGSNKIGFGSDGAEVVRFGQNGIEQIKGVAYTWPGSQGGASTYLKNDGSGGLTWASASGGGGSLDSITADAASSTIQNGSFTNIWRWTDPGANQYSFQIQGTNSTASSIFAVRGQVKTSASAVLMKIGETLASTSEGALLGIDTLASSTADPLWVSVQGTNVIRVRTTSPTGQVILGDVTSNTTFDGTAALPMLAWGAAPDSGWFRRDGYEWNYSYHGTETVRLGAEGVTALRGVTYKWPTTRSAATLNVDGSGNLTWTGPHLGYVATASTTVANTTTTTTIIPSGVGSLAAGDSYAYTGRSFRITLSGYIENHLTDTFEIALAYGATTIVLQPTLNFTVSPVGFKMVYDGTFRTVGSMGTLFVQSAFIPDQTGNLGPTVSPTTSASTINTTTSNDMDVIVTWSAAQPDDSITVSNFTLEWLN
jgi:hypothetical protein